MRKWNMYVALVLAICGLAIGASTASACVVWDDGPPVVIVDEPVIVAESGAQIDRTGGCIGGVFVDGTVDQIASGLYVDATGVTFAISASPYVEGVGLTCNTEGYTDSGYAVAGDDGLVNSYAPNNVHEYYTA